MSAEHPGVVFVSYAHADNEAHERDRRWLDRLLVHLEPLRQQVELAVFSDKQLAVGDLWDNEIQGKLHAATAAVLLVSPAFLASTYIRNCEMPILLRRAEEEGVAILPLFVKPCASEEVKFRYPDPEEGPAERSLADFQAFNSPDNSLLDMGEAEQERTLAAVVTRLREIICPGSSPAPSPTPIEHAAPLVLTHRLPPSGPDLFGRSEELRQLSRAWNNLHTHLITLVAFGGVGKTALVNHWLARIAKEDYRGAGRVYGWSAYSQGSKERVTSADQFIDEALRFFGDDRPPGESIETRAVRLAELVRRERTLLVLDGIESLQYPPGPGEGHIKDPGLRTLVRELAAQNPGLCVITTRVRVSDLAGFETSTCPRIDLELLDPPDGARLLASLGVQGPEDELRAASEAFGGHALALTLLGTFLRDACGGDVRRRGEIGPLEHEIQHGGHARRVMDSYETWLGDGPERQILRMLGLFDRPAEPGALRALRREPPIAGLTDRIAGLDQQGWQEALVRLRHARLVLEPDDCDRQALDAHPLVREHFGEKLREEDGAAWRAGHDRLFEYYRGEGCTKELPDTLEEMAPLFAAVQHGCAAGRHQEALEEVFWARIRRREQSYSPKKLGAFGPDLAALSGFFDPPWNTPVAALSDADKGFVLAVAGFDLRALGRLAEAVEPMQAGLDAPVAQESWVNAATSAGNLSELHLTLGGVAEAIAFAERSVQYADRTEDAFERLKQRAKLGDALHHAGRVGEAEERFREAEAIQKDDQPKYPLLCSVAAHRYCDLLLTRGRHDEVLARATQTLEWVTAQNWLLDIGLDHVSLARAALLAAQSGRNEAVDQARSHAQAAVDTLRQAGQQDEVARGLLGRAEVHRFTGERDAAGRDLAEAMAIATRDPAGHMKLHETDCHLGFARLALDERKPDVARQHLAAAEALIRETGYGRREPELAELKEAVGPGE
ncbi:MAG TPA: TIR domain-containing protein [Thermoguttaceae bacterium]|nr:TIR domain-containing protein [Thermoguttaceae bacterium]